MRIIVTLLAMVLSGHGFSQTFTTRNVMTLGDAQSPEATIDDVSWIQGYWTGAIFGDRFEEIWSPPINGTMMGSFKHLDGENVNFYELMTISEEEGSLMFRLKHFNADMTGWEEKNEVISWPLVKIDKQRAYFDGLTFEKLDDDQIKVYLAVSMKEGEVQEFTAVYQRGEL